eukprot:scaffold588_cov389-Prasinococcus_capsulatus_cf.AAC.1
MRWRWPARGVASAAPTTLATVGAASSSRAAPRHATPRHAALRKRHPHARLRGAAGLRAGSGAYCPASNTRAGAWASDGDRQRSAASGPECRGTAAATRARAATCLALPWQPQPFAPLVTDQITNDLSGALDASKGRFSSGEMPTGHLARRQHAM